MKLIVDVKSDVVVGAHMVGEDAPEIMQGLETFTTTTLTESLSMLICELNVNVRYWHCYEDEGNKEAV